MFNTVRFKIFFSLGISILSIMLMWSLSTNNFNKKAKLKELSEASMDLVSSLDHLFSIIELVVLADHHDSHLLELKTKTEETSKYIKMLNAKESNSKNLESLNKRWNDELLIVIQIIQETKKTNTLDIDYSVFKEFQNDVLTYSAKLVRRLLIEIKERDSRQEHINLFLMILSFFGVSFFIYIIADTFKKSLAMLKIAEKIKEGDYSQSFETKGSDEIYLIGKALTDMSQKLITEKSYTEALLDSFNELIITTTDEGVISNSNGKISGATNFHLKNKKILDVLEFKKANINWDYLTNTDEDFLFIDEEATLTVNKIGIPVLVNSTSFQLEDGTNFYVFLIIDIRESKLYATLEKQRKLLIKSEKLATIGELAAGVGHEINNPLTILSSILFKIRTDLESNDQTNDFLDKQFELHETTIKRIKHIVDGLRVLSRKESKEDIVFDLNQLVTQTSELVTEIFTSENVNFEFKVPEKIIYLKGDPIKLQQVITNLLMNAKDATENIENRNVNILVGQKNGDAIIQVQDNGTGIPDEIKDKIFESFFTTKKVGKGTGIGLHIVYQYVQSMSGKIDLVTKTGKGTKFVISIPHVMNYKNENNPLDDKKYQLIPDELIGKKVLICDDEPEIRDYLKLLIRPFKFFITECDNGMEGYREIQKNEFDLIITDLKMPILDGPGMICKIKEDHTIQTTPLILTISGGINSDVKTEKYHDLINGTLQKPFDQIEIINKICEVFESN